MTANAQRATKLAFALTFLLAGAAGLVFQAHQHASSLDAVWPDKPTAKRGPAPPLAAQHAALGWPPGEGLTIELPVGNHWGERHRVAMLFTTLLTEEYQTGWISRVSHDLRGVLPEALWPCITALGAGTSEDFDAFNRWLLDPEHRLSRPGCTLAAATPTSYVPVRFAFVASADAPHIANTHWAVWVALFVAGITSIAGGLMGCVFILGTGNRIDRATRDDDGQGPRS